MKLMEVELPQGLHVKNAVFCAIEGELAGIFALNYTLPDMVFPSLEALMREKVGPVLATRDFNLIPAMLHQRFKLGGRQDGLSAGGAAAGSCPTRDQPHSSTITAVLCREGLLPMGSRWWLPSAALVHPVRRGADLSRLLRGGLAGLLSHLCGRLRLPVPFESVGLSAVLAGPGVVFDQLDSTLLNPPSDERSDP